MAARGHEDRNVRVLVVGWFSFLDGEATAGDVGAAETVCTELDAAGITHETAWSPNFRPEGLDLDEAEERDYSDLVFVCGPLSGPQVQDLHRRFPRCHRVAVGVSVVDPEDPAARGFHTILPRDVAGEGEQRDLAPGAPVGQRVPVVGVTVAPGQPEYGTRSAHADTHERLGRWLANKDCARVPLDTRLDTRDWLHCADTTQFDSLIHRTDLVVTTRLHGLVLALRNGVPALAVDPVTGGAKVAAQGRAWNWPVVTVTGTQQGPNPWHLEQLWRWCRNEGREAARARARGTTSPLAEELTQILGPRQPSR
ncbi:MAG TPA: polysaccharide pyruvyl transferase family protein [Candidatus Nocardiopsis merdipullorum]|nr:polysaccharide pyruvyl transferase family protein [Candidatus Nocardiopsis merdipullorum]